MKFPLKKGTKLYLKSHLTNTSNINFLIVDYYDTIDDLYDVRVFYHQQIFPIKSQIYGNKVEEFYTTKRKKKLNLPTWF